MLDIIIPYGEQDPQRLDIYSDRQQQLHHLLRELMAYLQAKQPELDYHITIVERVPIMGDYEFNRGLIRNIGAALTTGDQICFHDCDYVPVDADYTACAQPTRLITQGLREYHNDLDNFWGAVLMMPRTQFLAANGYSNHYANWGWEDTDLGLRLQDQGLTLAQRPGVFLALDHPSQGFDNDGELRNDSVSNQVLYAHRLNLSASDRQWENMRDGINRIEYRYRLIGQDRISPRITRIQVRLDHSQW